MYLDPQEHSQDTHSTALALDFFWRNFDDFIPFGCHVEFRMVTFDVVMYIFQEESSGNTSNISLAAGSANLVILGHESVHLGDNQSNAHGL
jgi:hypothetical protein